LAFACYRGFLCYFKLGPIFWGIRQNDSVISGIIVRLFEWSCVWNKYNVCVSGKKNMQQELTEVLIGDDENDQSEELFIKELYNDAKEFHRRSNDGIYVSDFLFDMIQTSSNCYWMSAEHPIARMLKENGLPVLGTFSGQLGYIIVYSKESVSQCLECILDLCKKYELKIINDE
jgi:hypothetical protein